MSAVKIDTRAAQIPVSATLALNMRQAALKQTGTEVFAFGFGQR